MDKNKNVEQATDIIKKQIENMFKKEYEFKVNKEDNKRIFKEAVGKQLEALNVCPGVKYDLEYKGGVLIARPYREYVSIEIHPNEKEGN